MVTGGADGFHGGSVLAWDPSNPGTAPVVLGCRGSRVKRPTRSMPAPPPMSGSVRCAPLHSVVLPADFRKRSHISGASARQRHQP